jgi:hypothetical protein
MVLMQSSIIAEIKGRPEPVPLYFLLDAHADGGRIFIKVEITNLTNGCNSNNL